MPTNRMLDSTSPDGANDVTRNLIMQWGRLHAMRSALGLAATAVYLWALN